MATGFTSLPPELRNRIYRLWLADGSTKSTITISRALVQRLQATLHQPMALNTTIHNHFGSTPAWLSTCRQVRLEALALWLDTVEFTYCSTDADDPDRRIACDLMDVLEQMQLPIRWVSVAARSDWAGLTIPLKIKVGSFHLHPSGIGRSSRRVCLSRAAVSWMFTNKLAGLPRKYWVDCSNGPFAQSKTTILLQWTLRRES